MSFMQILETKTIVEPLFYLSHLRIPGAGSPLSVYPPWIFLLFLLYE